MKVEFHRPDDPETVVATAEWDGAGVMVEADDDAVRALLEDAYRRVPVVTDDASYRPQGTRGEVLIQPGSLAWFRAVSQVRAPAKTGLVARLLPAVTQGGYDPAAGYRTFEDTIERLDRRAGA